MCLVNMSLKRMSVILLDDFKITSSFTFFWQDRKISFDNFLNWRDVFSKYFKVIRTSFFIDVRFWWLPLTNNLLGNVWTHLLMKNNGNEFFCEFLFPDEN